MVRHAPAPPKKKQAAPARGGRTRRVRKEPEAVVGGRLWRVRRWLFVAVLLAAGMVSAGLYELTRIPLPAPHRLAQTTFIYDATGKRIASFSEQNRVDVSLKQVPQVVVDAVVSTEDRHFFSEGAVNPISIVRAVVNDVTGSGNLQGASTITQQYVKQTYLSSERTLSRKVKEAGLSIRVSRTMSKQQILQGYLNTIYWGRGAYGIEAAAETYFGTTVDHLDLKEASLLAGMIREPDLADPTADPSVARRHQQDTLRAMVRDHRITQDQATAAAAVPFSQYVKARRSASVVGGLAPNGEDYFIDAVRQQLVAKYGASVVDGGGLRVTTTLDPTLQGEAYNSVYGNSPGALHPRAGDPSGALVSMDDNGEVKALVGGEDYKASTVDLALGKAGGGGGRQPGSTFKTLMLAALIKLGYSPQSVFPAPPAVEIPHGNANGAPYTVTNFEHESTAPQMNIVDATAFSVNTVYVQVIDRMGPAALDSMAAQLGIPTSELEGNLSEVLGTDEVSPLEMDAAYATFADGGVYHAPLLITRVTDSAGRDLPLPVTPVSRPVLTPTQAAEVTYILEQVVLRGTGTSAGGVGSPVAGKTGTTDNSANAWFIGYTPNLTTAVWMGYSDGFRPMVNYRGLTSVQGGTIPAQLWHYYMAAALASEPQWAGQFQPVYWMGGMTLTPPGAGTVLYPEGMGTTTTTSTTTTVPTSTTVAPTSRTTVAGTGRTPPTTRPSTATTSRATPTTAPPTTAPGSATTKPVSPTTAATG
ncbi:MAG TPA: transglycosylase domain-containing protein [Acidimicrobiales bacterium]|nr:transglycosylase domain-containing protein [Acidimicrobiales bacterium]